MPKEVELKLEIAPKSAKALLASNLFGEACSEESLHATYFDTPKRELRRHGHSLRIRNSGAMAIQTIKSGDIAAGLFTRGEWELPVVGKQPIADSRTPVSDLLAKRIDELAPLFDVPAVRRKYRLHSGEAEIEIAVDQAQVVAGERTIRFCEVELELLAGPSAALFELAHRIDAVVPVRISVQSKAERGYSLLERLPASVKADEIPLDPCMDLPTAFAAIASACLKQYRLNEAILIERYVPEAVHQARIGIRRLRSAMVLFKQLLDGPERDKLNARLRELAQCLGEARDLDVLAGKAEPGVVLDRLNLARDAAHAAVARKLKSKSTRMLLLDVTRWIADGAWRSDPATQELRDMPLPVFAVEALDRLRRKTAKHGRHLASLDIEARHQVRKDAKKLRYGVEFLAPLFHAKGRLKKFVRTLTALQDDLGELNDRATAEERLAALGLASTPDGQAFLTRWKSENLIEDAARARHALLEVKPFWR